MLASLFAGIYFELFFETSGYYSSERLLAGYCDILTVLCILSYSAFFYLPACALTRIESSSFEKIVKFRYLFGAITVAVFVITDINLSSISIWAGRLGEPDKAGLLFGQARWVRSDEYNVSSLWFISQSSNGWGPFSSSLVGGGVDTRLIYNCPSWAVATIFRPSLWGFLLFGASRGLAWKSILRIVLTDVARLSWTRF